MFSNIQFDEATMIERLASIIRPTSNPMLNGTTVEDLVEQLVDPNLNVKRRVINMLIRHGEDAIPHLIAALDGQPDEKRASAQIVLEKIGEAAVEPLLKKAEEAESEIIVERIIDILEKIGDHNALRALLVILDKKTESIKRAIEGVIVVHAKQLTSLCS